MMMTTTIFIAIMIIIAIIIIVHAHHGDDEQLSPFDDVAMKLEPGASIHDGEQAIIPAIEIADPELGVATRSPSLSLPLGSDTSEPTDEEVREHAYESGFSRPMGPPVHVAPIALTFDAAVAGRALMTMRDKRTYDTLARRTTDYWRPIFEEELNRCENRDWWDDVDYPMNDPGTSDSVPDI